MKVVVDSNIVFSAILQPIGKIGDILFNSSQVFKFYAVNFLKDEITKHQAKLLELSKLSEDNLNERKTLVYLQLEFIDEFLLPQPVILNAENLLFNIDVDDTLHVALAMYLNGRLWTGDKILLNGLKEKLEDFAIDTNDLWELRSKISQP